MDNVVTISPLAIGGHVLQTCNARDLHAYLEVGKDFSTWIKDRIDQYEFVQDVDFTVVNPGPQNGGAGNRGQKIEYFLSLDMAKELSMVERSTKGKEARRYFIDCERQAREALAQLSAPPAPDVDAIQKAEAIIAQRDLAVAYHLNAASLLTGKNFRAVKPPKPRTPKSLPAPDEKTRVALDALLGKSLEFQGEQKTLRDLLQILATPAGEQDLMVQGSVANALRVAGIVVEGALVLFGTGVPYLQEVANQLFGDKQGLRPFLTAIPGAVRTDKTQSFAGAKSKVVKVPLAALFPAAIETTA